jgi:hypothetical protein
LLPWLGQKPYGPTHTLAYESKGLTDKTHVPLSLNKSNENNNNNTFFQPKYRLEGRTGGSENGHISFSGMLLHFKNLISFVINFPSLKMFYEYFDVAG